MCLAGAMTVLIGPHEVAELLLDPRLILLDVQGAIGGPPGRESYAAAHLPGARFLDLDADLADPPGPRGRHPLPDLSRLQGTLRRLGISADSVVVVYDARTSLYAARAWWVLTYAGLPGVRVLDGGLAAWQRAGYHETTIVPPDAAVGTVALTAGALPSVDSAGAAQVALGGILLDSRSAERFRGEVEPIDAVAGHIPGAVNAPMAEYLDDEGCFRNREELHGYFAGKGVFDHDLVATSCGSGVTATHTALALRQIGIHAAVYVGSWSEWITETTRPIATGPT